MKVETTDLPGVLLLTPDVYRDNRGYFLETHRTSDIAERIPGLEGIEFVQGNLSSSMPYTLRGMHYQLHEPQGKLVRCIAGKIFDVAVDVRVGSPTFGKWTGHFLDEMSAQALYVPPGFAHGFLSLSLPVKVQYECTTYYRDAWARGINWRDPRLEIGWPIAQGRMPIISNKDRAAPTLDEMMTRGELPAYDGGSQLRQGQKASA